MNRALRVHWRSHLKEKPLVHMLSGCSMWAKMWHLKKKKKNACVLKKDRVGRRMGGGSHPTKVRQRTVRQQSALRLPAAACRREIRPVREWGGWLNDFTSPFQLQQLPIYIVMQIHGLSQMVLFQHRGCIEIWLFIPSTSKVFNAPSSVCFYPFLSFPGRGLKSVQPDVSLPNGSREKE